MPINLRLPQIYYRKVKAAVVTFSVIKHHFQVLKNTKLLYLCTKYEICKRSTIAASGQENEKKVDNKNSREILNFECEILEKFWIEIKLMEGVIIIKNKNIKITRKRTIT